jgi:hypothetical protein
MNPIGPTYPAGRHPAWRRRSPDAAPPGRPHSARPGGRPRRAAPGDVPAAAPAVSAATDGSESAPEALR